MSTKTTLHVAATLLVRSGGASLVAALAIAGAAGCAHKPAATASMQTTAAEVTRPDREVNLSDDLRKACKVEEDASAPRFDYDSIGLSTADRDVLAQVARCLTTGPLKGRAVQMIGRADPRGETEYNMTLGESRAASVQIFLAGLGVAKEKMALTSRGELDATGKDEEGWRLDRRVDLRLAPRDTGVALQ